MVFVACLQIQFDSSCQHVLLTLNDNLYSADNIYIFWVFTNQTLSLSSEHSVYHLHTSFHVRVCTCDWIWILTVTVERYTKQAVKTIFRNLLVYSAVCTMLGFSLFTVPFVPCLVSHYRMVCMDTLHGTVVSVHPGQQYCSYHRWCVTTASYARTPVHAAWYGNFGASLLVPYCMHVCAARYGSFCAPAVQ